MDEWSETRNYYYVATGAACPCLNYIQCYLRPCHFIIPLYPVSVALLGTSLPPIPQDVDSKGPWFSHFTNATSFKRHLEAASLLLENGADPNSRNHLGRVLLYMVSQGDREESSAHSSKRRR